MKRIDYEEALYYLLRGMGGHLGDVERQVKFIDTRRWAFDLAWPQSKVAVELDGAVWAGGRHTRGAGFIADTEKLNAATLLGWRVLRFPAHEVKARPAWIIEIISRLINNSASAGLVSELFLTKKQRQLNEIQQHATETLFRRDPGHTDYARGGQHAPRDRRRHRKANEHSPIGRGPAEQGGEKNTV